MSRYVVDGNKLTAVAEAIRDKTETSSTMTLDEMPNLIESIETGSDFPTIDLDAVLRGEIVLPEGDYRCYILESVLWCKKRDNGNIYDYIESYYNGSLSNDVVYDILSFYRGIQISGGGYWLQFSVPCFMHDQYGYIAKSWMHDGCPEVNITDNRDGTSSLSIITQPMDE